LLRAFRLTTSDHRVAFLADFFGVGFEIFPLKKRAFFDMDFGVFIGVFLVLGVTALDFLASCGED